MLTDILEILSLRSEAPNSSVDLSALCGESLFAGIKTTRVSFRPEQGNLPLFLPAIPL